MSQINRKEIHSLDIFRKSKTESKTQDRQQSRAFERW